MCVHVCIFKSCSLFHIGFWPNWVKTSMQRGQCKDCFQKHEVCFLLRPNTLISPDICKHIELSYNKTQMPEAHLASFLFKKQPQFEQIRYHVIRLKTIFPRQKEKYPSNRTLIGKTHNTKITELFLSFILWLGAQQNSLK